MSKIFFIRHGQASFGSDDYDRLSNLGREQAGLLGAYWDDRKVGFDAVYSSDLKRSRLTAEYYAKCFGIRSRHKTAALNEVDYRILYKKDKKWVAKEYPQHKKDPNFVYPQGESFSQMQVRSASYLSSLATTLSQQTILIVVHSGVIRGLVSHFLDLNYAQSLKYKISHRYIGDFLFAGQACVGYNELGKESGFVSNGIIELPVTLPISDVVAEDRIDVED